MDILNRLFSLSGKRALVTGASGGIGGAIARAYAEAGAIVAVHGTQDEKTRLAAEAIGHGSVPLVGDVSTGDGCRKLIDDTVAALGGLDILVNNAGINRRKPVETFTDDDFDAITAVNQKGVLALSMAAHPHLKASGGGKVIHIGSMTSYIGLGNVAVYGMTKAAVRQLAQTMAVEWAKDNIQVNCLAPGFIVTPLTAAGVAADPKRSKWILHRIAAGRWGNPDDLIGAALLLASPASDYLTGQTIAVDGGFLAGGSWDNP